jgi:Gnt-I system high-affinity gluconate transporter
MPLLIIAAAILMLLLLSLKKVNPFIGLLLATVTAGLLLGMPLPVIAKSIEKGVGSTLGGMALVLCLGAMLGKLLQVSGAAQQISNALIKKFGAGYVQWAIMITGLVVGIPLFYNAGFVILVPLVFSIAKTSGKPLLYIAIPMAASLSVTHGFLPPHPGPIALAAIFKANVGKVMLYGICLAIPVIIIAGPLFANTLKKIKAQPVQQAVTPIPASLPPVSTSVLIALLPVLLIAIPALLQYFLPQNKTKVFIAGLGEPVIALLMAVIAAAYWLGIKRKMSMQQVMECFLSGVEGIAMILIIIAAGGAFKQVLTGSGTGDYITKLTSHYSFSPLLAGWLVAALIRVTLGSATVAALTAAGIVAPMVTQGLVSAELMVLSVGAGSLLFSHVNDTGFWMFKEYFGLSLKHTFLSWSLMETIVSILGLCGVLLLQALV